MLASSTLLLCQTCSDAASKLSDSLKNFKPFTISFTKDSFGYFKHKQSCTLWLKPLLRTDDYAGDLSISSQHEGEARAGFQQSTLPHHPDTLKLQSQLHAEFPMCDDLSKISEAGFQPHLSLGQFKSSNIDEFASKFQEEWVDFELKVSEIYLISRKDFNDPFHIRHSVRLGGAE